MATRALIQAKVERSHASMRFSEIYSTAMRFAEIYSGPLPAIRESKASNSTPQKADDAYVSSAAALRGAKGALMALGAEAAAALCLFGLWWFWHV